MIKRLTDSGRDTTRQLLLAAAEEDPTIQVLRLLESRPVSEAYLKRKIPKAANAAARLEWAGSNGFRSVQRAPL